MTLEVYLRDTTTGTAGLYIYDNCPDNFRPHDIEFHWTEGDYGCDCNRSLFLYGDAGPEYPCGDGRIAVDRVVIRETGKVLCERGEWR